MEKIQTWLYKERQILSSITSTITDNIVSLSLLVGVVMVATIPAMLTGISVYFYTEPVWGHSLALLMAVASGLGIETVGIVATSVALKLYAQQQKLGNNGLRLFLAVCLVLFYAVAVDGIIYFLDNLPGPIIGLGIVAPWLAVALYTARGLHQEVEDAEDRLKVEAEQARTDETIEQAFKREERRKAAERRHELKLKELESPRKVSEAQPKVSENFRKLPDWLPRFPKNLKDWRLMLEEGMEVPGHLTMKELGDIIGQSERTAGNWMKEVK